MASQVEIASSSAPFGCVLKDHNRRERNNAAFQKNLKEFVRDHLHTCISVSSDENSRRTHVDNGGNSVNHNARRHLRCLTNQQDHNSDDSNVDDGSVMSGKQARIFDGWAAKQAQEMVSTIENPNHSQETAFSTISEKISSSGVASSLVQIWEARMSQPAIKIERSNSFKNNSNSTPTTSRTASTSSYNEIPSSSIEEPPRNSDITDSAPNEDALADLESTAQSSVNSRNSDAGESERVRVSDIIRRLTSDSGSDHEQASSISCASDQPELRAFSQIVNSPKIRGRQAYNDLLYQMEQDRQRELESLSGKQSVSRFPQRGRIQAMLRLRFLQRGVAIQDQQRSQSIRSTLVSHSSRFKKCSTIMHLRERFSSGGDAEHATTSLNDAATPRNTKEKLNDISVNNENISPVSHVNEENHHQEICIAEQQTVTPAEDALSQISGIHDEEEEEEEEEDAHEETSTASDNGWQGASSEGENFEPREAFGSRISLNHWDDEEIADQQDYDWFTDIARPRSYWEDQRQAWYQEMLNTSSDTSEIRQLLERRTVSTFLSSDFRDRMDQLMESHVQRQVNEDDGEELDEESQERMGQLILSFFEQHSHQPEEEEDQDGVEETEEDDEEEEEEEEEGGGQEVLHEEVDEYGRQQEEDDEEEESPPSVHSSSPFTSWNYSPQNHGVVDNSEHTSLPSRHRQYFASPSHSSIEMELIHDLRGNMEQMQREMSELKNSMQTMQEMQANMQNSMKQEAHPVQEASKNAIDIATKKRNCCICYEMPVDSFLYRCGHMCTCLKCAHELQWSSGKCPICRAPILDVVRAYMDS
ncbi:uncharacterized protein LOC126681277 [Mercurialis annua]|uniref:uncharacterized protein LOC126681277 n=1 Tax=Mercurialis annua TaxID=3986 RepID=UPI0021602138|nr:uncharacterized protein LOC126681277 [Mercurialis annua]